MSFRISNIPDRSAKPRETGITLALDKGYSIRQAEDFCQSSAAFTDIVKFGWGTALVTPRLEEKVKVYQDHGIPVYFGGTLFEAYLMRNELDVYVAMLKDLGIKHIEVSDGTIHIEQERKLDIIRQLKEDFIVLSEVGSKNPNEIIAPYKWVKLIKSELDAGAWKVITEAREGGNVGVFRPNGEVRSGLIDEITDLISQDLLIFEAPIKEQQVWFMKKFGPNVNLGNISPSEVIPVETLRLGLRSDTLFDFHGNDEKFASYSDSKS
jgi:phosphosulfolactate synthase